MSAYVERGAYTAEATDVVKKYLNKTYLSKEKYQSDSNEMHLKAVKLLT